MEVEAKGISGREIKIRRDTTYGRLHRRPLGSGTLGNVANHFRRFALGRVGHSARPTLQLRRKIIS
jgi:hypothetical protein